MICFLIKFIYVNINFYDSNMLLQVLQYYSKSNNLNYMQTI